MIQKFLKFSVRLTFFAFCALSAQDIMKSAIPERVKVAAMVFMAIVMMMLYMCIIILISNTKIK